MTEFRTLVNELKEMDAENKLYSKVTTNRNWGIQLQTIPSTGERYATAGRWNSLTHCYFLTEIRERHIRWFSFTYKKDFKEMVKVLEDSGMTVYKYDEF